MKINVLVLLHNINVGMLVNKYYSKVTSSTTMAIPLSHHILAQALQQQQHHSHHDTMAMTWANTASASVAPCHIRIQ
jgi:hypothetical protein